MTINAAYQHFEDDIKGSIEVGKQADLVVLSEDPLSIDIKNLLDVNVVATFSRGAEVFNAAK
jgi:predicted amidohydrolase YtcJ